MPIATSYQPFIEPQKSAFGEAEVAEPTPVVQLQFPYNINTRLVNTNANGGSVTFSANKARISTGSGTNQSAQLLSRREVKYNPGQGALIRFTAVFTAGAANSTQYAGIGDAADGLFFGYNGTAFGVMRRQGGSVEIQTLTITTASSTSEDITITLNGNAKADVTVTDSGVKETTAREIAVEDYSAVGGGWNAEAVGDTVIFISFGSGDKAGAFTLSAPGTAVGAFAETVAGVSPTETVVAQTSWSEDKAAGAETLPSLTFTNGNVFQIRYQWLGFGAIEFSIENPSTGRFVLVHRIEYANSATIPSIDNPTLPLCVFAGNTSNASDIVVETSSMAGFVEGKDVDLGFLNSAEGGITNLGNTELPILSIRNKRVFQGKLNRARIAPLFVALATLSTKPVIFRVRVDTALTGSPSFSDVAASTSMVATDTSASGVSGGNVILTTVLGKENAEIVDLTSLRARLLPGELFTVTGQAASGTNQEVNVSLTWDELL
jgi:hypothetical protein